MRLHRSAPPAGPLAAAPVTALRHPGGGAWAGYWAGDDAYYACRTGGDGAEEWYRGELLEDGEPAPGTPAARAARAAREAARTPAARVLPLRRGRGRRRRLVLVGRRRRA